MFKKIWMYVKRIWESEKGQLIDKLHDLLDLLKPFVAEMVQQKSNGKLTIKTSQNVANDVIEEIKAIIKRQL